jgi:DNA-binding CsgD family transcriptional regulator
MNYQEAQEVLQKEEAAKALLEKYKKLESAHEELGFRSRRELIRALEELDGKRGGRSGKRARLTPQAREQLEAAIQSGKPASEIASQFGVSQPYVYALKSRLKAKGLTSAIAAKKPAVKKKAGGRKKKK